MPPRGGDARASTRSCAGARAVTLCRDRRGDGERSHDRNATQQKLHEFDPPLPIVVLVIVSTTDTLSEPSFVMYAFWR